MRTTAGFVPLVALVVGAAGCGSEPRPPADRAGAAPTPAAAPVAATLPVPHDSTIPPGDLGSSIRRGRALLTHTRDSLPRYVGNALTCSNCHPNGGTLAGALPYVGVYGQFPQYRSRSASVQVIEDRIDDCFIRSMNGRPLPRKGRDMYDIVAYLSFLSRGVPGYTRVDGQGLTMLSVTSGDTTRGAEIFGIQCARCHAANGDGTAAGPPVWGPRSFNVGAGMARVRTAAAFIKANMPYDRRGSLTEQQAFDVAAYITSRPRPDFKGKERDWPRGDPPPDVAYPTLAAARKAAPATAEGKE
jgi:thiosulfate dehydrogenase